jgi:hypothetical protein
MAAAASPGGRTGGRAADLAAPALLLVAPFLAFVRGHGYAPWRPEIVLCLAALAAAGALAGAAARAFGPAGRVLLLAALAVALVDVQTDAIRSAGGAVVVGAAALAVAWLLREHLATLVAAVVGTAVLATLVLPVGRPPAPPPRAAAAPPAPGLPVVLHVILDEQLGVDGIPTDLPGGAALRAWLLDWYAARGFRVFTRAYSRYAETHNAIANALNLSARDVDAAWFRGPGPFREGAHPDANAWFAAMAARGHAIHVYQSDFLDLCGTQGGAHVRSCFTYGLETIAAFEHAPIPTFQKARLVAGVYRRLSFFASGANEAARPPVRVATLSVMPVLDRIAAHVRRARPGDMLVAHVLMPHHPYVFDRGCALRPLAEWGTGFSRAAFPLRNTPASRAASYPLYFEQVVCLHRRLGALLDGLRAAGTLDRALVVLHGDHGSRLEIVPPNARFADSLSPADYVDAFSTLFAVRAPDVAPGRDDRPLPLDALLASLLSGRVEVPARPQVFLAAGPRAPLVPRPMPPFGRGAASASGRAAPP